MSQCIELRRFTPADGPAVAALHRRAILAVHPRFYGRTDRESWAHGIDPQAYAGIVEDHGEEFILAEVALGMIIGFCSFKMQGSDGVICGLYTAPESQRRGTGSALLTHAETALATRGVSRFTVSSSLSGVAFYERHGYHITLRSRHMTRGGREIEIREMEKIL